MYVLSTFVRHQRHASTTAPFFLPIKLKKLPREHCKLRDAVAEHEIGANSWRWFHFYGILGHAPDSNERAMCRKTAVAGASRAVQGAHRRQ